MADDSFDHKMDGSGFGQPTGETCWYACYAMIYGWKQKPISSIKDAIPESNAATLDSPSRMASAVTGAPRREDKSALTVINDRGSKATSMSVS